MESNSNTSYESLLFNGKSPESSDCEGYGTPLASSLTDLANVARWELTPVSSRAISPACVREIMYLQKSSNLVMTQRMLSEEDIRRMLEQGLAQGQEQGQEQGEGSEEEFFDTADEEASELEDIVVDSDTESEVKPDDDDVAKVTASLLEKVADIEPVNEEDVMEVVHVEENAVLETSQTVDEEEVGEVPMEVEVASEIEETSEVVEVTPDVVEVAPEVVAISQEEDRDEQVEAITEGLVESETVDTTTEDVAEDTKEDNKAPVNQEVIIDVEFHEADDVNVLEALDEIANSDQLETPTLVEVSQEEKLIEEEKVSEDAAKNASSVSQDIEVAPEAMESFNQQVEPEAVPEDVTSASKQEDVVEVVEMIQEVPEVEITASDVDTKLMDVQENIEIVDATQITPDVSDVPDAPDASEIAEVLEQMTETVAQNEIDQPQSPENVEKMDVAAQIPSQIISREDSQEVTVTIADDFDTEIVTATVDVSPVSYSSGVNTLDSGVSEQTSSNSSESGKLSYTPVSVQLLKSKFEAPHKEEVIDALPTLVNSDEVKATSGAVKVDFDADNDADCELDGESLSSSTSTESFEFAETIPNPPNTTRSPESTQALRNSINERYPSHETDEELDNEFDDDLLAVKQISAEVEQLVAAINAFGRDEEQQMSAYLVGKNMAAEKKRKLDASLSSRSDQLVQTDTDFILVDRHLPKVMESLQAEIARLQADLTTVKLEEKELQKLNAKLQDELQESQQTIDGIEVEAEQQYTELTSEIDELCGIVLKKDEELANLKEKVANLSVSEINHKDDVDAQRVIVQRQKEIIEGLREELDNLTKKLSEVTKSRDKAIEDATIYKMKNMERDRFLSKEAQMSMEIEDLQRELNKQKLILNNTSMAKLADTFDRKVLHLENELRERDMLICKQNQIINSHRKSPTGSIITQRKMQPRASVLAAAGNLNSAGSSSESFQNGLDIEAKEALLSFILSDRHNQLANIYNIGRILDLTSQEERAVERHLTKDRFT